ncbi:MAG: hypothetical protein NVV74_02760 [Magnetospirillum sp.]|nr:hypothetical protein [Magnetospirillum sp.]
MRLFAAIAALSTLLSLGACGGDEKRTVVVTPAPGQTVVVPPEGDVRKCPPGETSC